MIFWGHHEKRATAGRKEVRRRALRRREPLGTVSSRVAVDPSNNRNFTNTENTAIQIIVIISDCHGSPCEPNSTSWVLAFHGQHRHACLHTESQLLVDNLSLLLLGFGNYSPKLVENVSSQFFTCKKSAALDFMICH